MSSSTNNLDRAPLWALQTPSLARSVGSAQRLRNEDSWIEISSQPSSSSLSSAGDNDVVTTGLRIRRRPSRPRRRPLHINTSSEPRILLPTGPASANGSSQDEYEESESESDRVMSSSNEDVGNGVEHNEDDNCTALGVRTAENTVFTPQPNAFSHPPRTNRASSGPVPGSYFPLLPESGPSSAQLSSARTLTQRNTTQQCMSVPRSLESVPQAPVKLTDNRSIGEPDHDAALRASLTTLLSCAAAVRGSPKQMEKPAISSTHRQPRAEPRGFRLVSEAQLLEEDTIPTSGPSARRTSSKALPPATKRKSRESSKERHAKKARNTSSKAVTEEELALQSTLTSWMISAGVVLFFSAISFSAGYAWGKEVGRFEGEMGLGGRSCGQEVLRGGGGLRRLKWSTASSSIRA